jgi:hypothetical protein
MGGMLAVAFGCGVILYIYAFSNMISPQIVGWDRWKTVLGKMFFTLNIVPTLVGAAMVFVGTAWTVLSVRRESSVAGNAKQSSRFGIVGTILLGAAILFAAIACLM